MRSEHNRGASLAAFLLAVSTVTLLFVSPVEGQGTPCTTDADCTDPSQPFCDVPEGATGGLCGECVVSAFPDETGSCPDIPPQLCGRSTGTTPSTACLGCASVTSFYGITTPEECEILATNLDQDADVVANCQRECFDFYACATNADCPGTLPFCDIDCELFFPINVICTPGQCVATDPSECVVSALPGEDDSCPDAPQEGFAGPQICSRTVTTVPKTSCTACAGFEQFDILTTLADCEILATTFNQTADVVANCQRECFGFYACATNADCPADRNICDAGQCFAEPGCGTNEDCPTTQPFCNVPDGETEGVCGECVVGAFPGENGSCPVLEGQDDAGRQICGRSPPDFSSTICVSCFSADEDEFEFGTDPTAADCEILATSFDQTEDVVANCQRECFAVYSCATNADCPDILPICNAGQCEISVFSALDGMGGGSSA